jgi:hypothetical protein
MRIEKAPACITAGVVFRLIRIGLLRIFLILSSSPSDSIDEVTLNNSKLNSKNRENKISLFVFYDLDINYQKITYYLKEISLIFDSILKSSLF